MRGVTVGLIRACAVVLCSATIAAGPAAAGDGQDIIRLLPPGPQQPSGPSLPPDKPSNATIPFPGNIAPPAAAQLAGAKVSVPLKIAASPVSPATGYVGIRVEQLAGEDLARALGLDRQPAVYVVDTAPGGPAATAGLRFGDFVLELDGAPVSANDGFVNAIRSKGPGTEATLTVWRVGDDPADYLRKLRSHADKGNPAVMIFVARLYALGIGVGRDPSEAVVWYTKAAEAGSTNGMLLLGDALASGTGTVKDVAAARSWIKKAADAGNVAALWRLGAMYRDGDGLDKDPLEAMNLFKKAAEAGYTPAMVAIGFMFEGGGGLEADHLQAVYWYKRAADQGDPEGMAVLGSKYYTGRGVERNFATAANWYSAGAKRGQLLAIHNLAVMYDKGQGVAKDPRTAAAYIYQALEQRYPFTYQQMTQSHRSWSREFRKELQQKLASAGRYNGPIDGNFSRSTLDAIDAMAKPVGR